MSEIPGVTVTGEVADVRPFYQQAWLRWFPCSIGGGTRLKIVESLCLGTPVVSTTIGAQGLELRNGNISCSPITRGDFAQSIGDLLTNSHLRPRLAEAGRAQVLARYTWRQLGLELSDYYTSLKDRVNEPN